MFLLRSHALLASFFLPLGIMFFVTGGLYTLEITGEYQTESRELALTEPLRPDLDQLEVLGRQVLAEQDLAAPTGGMRVRKAGTSFHFEWTGSNRDLVISPTENPLMAKVDIKDTTWHRRFVQLHKAKGGNAFKCFAVAGSLGLLYLFVSGALMAWRHPLLRKQSYIATALGIITFILLVAIS